MNKFLRHKVMAPEGGDGGSGGGDPGAGTGAPPAGSTLNGQPPASGSQDWRASLPDDIRGAPALESIKDVTGLAKSYLHAQSMIGRDRVALPSPTATPEELNEFYTKLGRPESPDGYKLTEEQIEGLTPDPEGTKWAQGLFHKYGLTPAQADGIFKEFRAHVGDQVKNLQSSRLTAQTEALEKLKAEWPGEKYDVNVQLANRALSTFGDSDLVEYLRVSGEGNNPQFIKLFAKIGSQLSEDRAFGSAATNSGFVAGPEAARAEIGKLNMDQSFQKAYLNKDAPGHADAVERLQRLYKVAYPGKVE